MVHYIITVIKRVTKWLQHENIVLTLKLKMWVSWFKKSHGLETLKFIENYYIELESFYLVKLQKNYH